MELTRPPQGFYRTVGVTRVVRHGGVSNRERGNVGNGVKIGGAVGVAYPKPFLPSGFETGIVALTLGTQGIDTLEAEALAVDRETVVVGNGFVFGATAVLLSIVPVFVIARTFARLGIAEGTTELLPQSPLAARFAVLVHGETGFADGIAGREFGRIFGVALVERNHGVTVIKFPYCVVNMFFVIRLVADEGAFIDGKHRFCSGEDILGDGSVVDVGRGCQLIEWQSGDAVNKNVVLVTPEEFAVLLVVLV